MQLPCGTFNINYSQDMALFRTPLQWVAVIAILVFLSLLPFFAGSFLLSFLIITGITIISVTGLSILTGYTGQISIGHSGFMGIGAYASALLSVKIGMPFWFAMPCGALFTSLVGLFFGIPSLRVKGLYLALITIACQFIIVFIINHATGLTGGTSGLPVPSPRIGGLIFDNDRSYYFIVLAITILMVLLAKNLVRTKVGRAFVAIRDNEFAAEAMGINPFLYKLLAFFIASFYAGVAGSIWAHYILHLTPEHISISDSIWFLGMIIVGGMGSITGSVLGVVFLKLLEVGVTIASPAVARAFPIIADQSYASLGQIVFGLVIVLFLIFEPRGLIYRLELLKAYYRMYPFSR